VWWMCSVVVCMCGVVRMRPWNPDIGFACTCLPYIISL
jgi:hypothetical protein